MALSITFHGQRPADGPGATVDALGKQLSDVQVVTGNFTATASGLYRIKATADQ